MHLKGTRRHGLLGERLFVPELWKPSRQTIAGGLALEKGRRSRPNIKLGIYGEHSGDPDSVKFCHRLGLNY